MPLGVLWPENVEVAVRAPALPPVGEAASWLGLWHKNTDTWVNNMETAAKNDEIWKFQDNYVT